MKSYEEVTNNLLERRDRYVVEQNRKRKRMMGAATSLCCCCLVAFMGFGVWQSGMLQNEPPVTLDSSIVGNNSGNDRLEQQTTNSNVETSQNPNNIEQTDNTVAKNEIRILEVENMPDVPQKMFIALMGDDFIRMNDDEINEYYGVNVFPVVPTDLDRKDEEPFGIFKRKANGEVYYDGNKISYTNADYSRGIAVNVEKNGLPFDFCNFFAIIETRSIINDVEVGIAQTPSGEMYAEFMHQNVGFRIWAYGLTQDEFVAAIESLLV